ncbi:hypothetical protein [Chondromyces apiculatus]|nr:hypothetical protein [Chondromyces apiculatus]
MLSSTIDQLFREAPWMFVAFFLAVLIAQLELMRDERRSQAKAADARHAESLSLMIAIRRGLVVRRPLNLREVRARATWRGTRRRRSGHVSTGLLGVVRGIFDADAALDNAWEPHLHCPLCVAEQIAAPPRPPDDEPPALRPAASRRLRA